MPSSGTSLSSLIGKDIGPYHLVRRLGVGGMAEAFEAVRRGPSGFTQRVCLKLVLPFYRDDRDFVQLFEREARLAARLRHRNIVGVIDFGEIEGQPYMALELVDGPDLRVLLDHQPGRRLGAEHVALLGLEISDALEHAHSPRPGLGIRDTESSTHGIVHRDISPSNVLISRQGEVMLTDFGVAKAMSGASRKQSAVKGKVPYMSPEQLRAEHLDGRADLFALGVVLFEALSGERPYEGAHDPATIMLILNGDRLALSKLVPDAPARLCEIIDSLLEPDRENRPENASALLELLDEFAPSPRVRRSLGTLAGEGHLAAKQEAAEISSVVADGPTERGLGPPAEDTGVKRAGSTVAQGPSEPPTPPLEGTPVDQPSDRDIPSLPMRAGGWSRRKVSRVIAATVVAMTGAGAVGIALWPAAEDGATGEDGETRSSSRDVAPKSAVEQKGVGQVPEQTPSASPEATEATATPPAEGEAKAPERAEPSPPKPVPPREPAALSVVVFPWGDVWINGEALGAAPIRNKTVKPGRYEIKVGQGSPSRTQTVRLRPGQRRTVRFDLTQ